MLDCGTDGLASTRGIAGATDWATLFITTGVGVQTVVIYPTLHLDTGNIWIALVSLLAGADWFVFKHSTESMISTSTWIFANFVDTGVSLSAFVIRGTSRQDGF